MTQEKGDKQRRNLQRLGWAILVAVILVAAAVAIGGIVVSKNAKDVGDVAVDQATGINALCQQKDVSVPSQERAIVAGALQEAGQCEKAKEVQAEAEDVGALAPATVTQQVTQEVDRAELMRFVREQVDTYCATRNSCTPDTALLVGIVANYFSLHPPQPGRAPTAEEITSAARAVIMEDPSLFKGDKGEVGENGPGASDEQVLQQVASYCAANNNCQGPQGVQGEQGDTGPTCPEGSSLESRTVTSTSDPTIVENWFVCVQDTPPPPTTTETETPPPPPTE